MTNFLPSSRNALRAKSMARACSGRGAANGKNRIPIVIPCHRVIAGDGGLGGFGGGLSVKEKLLALEKPRASAARSAS